MHKIYILIILVLMLSSCKRWQHEYPEDGGKTKLTPEQRLTGKNWKLNFVSFNGKDYTDTVLNQFGSYQLQFSLYPESQYYLASISTEYEGGVLAVWGFRFDDSKILIFRRSMTPHTWSYVPCFYTNEGKEYIEYLILKLTPSELKIKMQNLKNDSIVINHFIL